MTGGWGDSHSTGFYLKHWGLFKRLHQAPPPLLDHGLPRGVGYSTLKGLAWKGRERHLKRKEREGATWRDFILFLLFS